VENETYEQQMNDSNMICKQMEAANYDNFAEVQRAIVMLYVPDMSISRAGISHALKHLENNLFKK